MDQEVPTLTIQDSKKSAALKNLKIPSPIKKSKKTQKFSKKTTGIIAIVFILILSLSSGMTIFVLQNVENAEIKTENPQSLALKILSGNGFCDDATNTNAFNFDDGDCCLPKATPGNCILCICHINGKQIVSKTSTGQTSTTSVTSTTTTTTQCMEITKNV